MPLHEITRTTYAIETTARAVIRIFDKLPEMLQEPIFRSLKNAESLDGTIMLMAGEDEQLAKTVSDLIDGEPKTKKPKLLFKIASKSRANVTHNVVFDPLSRAWTCSCEDFTFNNNDRCKHIQQCVNGDTGAVIPQMIQRE